jgi:hypothetical protein
MADSEETQGVLTMVCVTCGAEQFFDDEPPPATMKCEKCEGIVFRAFGTPTTADEAAISGLEERARPMSYGDPSPGISTGELRELDRQ